MKLVPLGHVEAAKPFLSRQLRAVVALQLLTGARSGEILRLRPAHVDRAGKIWHSVLEEHKTAHHLPRNPQCIRLRTRLSFHRTDPDP